MDSGGNDVKTQFITREGTYRLMTLSEYSRPNRVGYTNSQGSSQVRVSFVTLPDATGNGDRLCFNYGKELYVYVYKGVKKVSVHSTTHLHTFNLILLQLTFIPRRPIWRNPSIRKCTRVPILRATISTAAP